MPRPVFPTQCPGERLLRHIPDAPVAVFVRHYDYRTGRKCTGAHGEKLLSTLPRGLSSGVTISTTISPTISRTTLAPHSDRAPAASSQPIPSPSKPEHPQHPFYVSHDRRVRPHDAVPSILIFARGFSLVSMSGG